MAQITTGIRAVLSHPAVYSAFQNLMGAHRFRIDFVREFIRPQPDCSILDIGCGPADILAYFPRVDYRGFDISPAYIQRASERFGERGTFTCKILTADDVAQLQKVDLVLALGLLHHMDDETAGQVLRLASSALKPGGRLVTYDPCFVKRQNRVARLLVRLDRGRNVRTQEGYRSLAAQVFDSPQVEVRHRTWIPYTHCLMECTRT